MSWSIGWDVRWQRDIGYGVPCSCDYPDCEAEIHRGLSYVCGGNAFGGEYGCGLFFCGQHQHTQDIGISEPGEAGAVTLCARCRDCVVPHTPKPDIPEWWQWKLTEESWHPWRVEKLGSMAL